MAAPPTLRIPDGSAEPVIDGWTAIEPAALLSALGLLTRTPAVLAVNGRSGGGKSTLAARLASAVPGAVVVATDDVAWHYSMFDWPQTMIDNVVAPVRRGTAVRYRPPGWIAQRRPGAITVEADRSLLIVEGVGSSQRAMADVIDASVWVQSDAPLARDRGIERDVVSGVNGDRAQANAFWDEWMADELPFLERDAPWSRADAFVAGVRPGRSDGLLWVPGPGISCAAPAPTRRAP